MVEEGLISREEAIARIEASQLDQLLHPMIDPRAEYEAAAKGLNASPGAAKGKIALDADTAEERGRAGEAVILVRRETTPDDIHGMIHAAGILTVHGGMTSHAAVVARGMGKPCVAGCEALSIDLKRRVASIAGRELTEDDVITIDGGTGHVILEDVDLVPPQINEDFETILGWADDARRLKVRANADTPEDAAKAREFGAEGIGLCRTEHMFMAEDRLPHVRAMIMASGEEERRAALAKLLPFQQEDFEGIFEAMAGLPGDDPAARPAAPRVPAAARGRGVARDGCADPRADRGEPDARDARLPARPPLPGDLRHAGAGDHPGRARGRGAARATRRSSRSCTRSSGSPRSSAACAS